MSEHVQDVGPVASPPPGLSAPSTGSDLRRVVLGGVAGQIIEFYDYALYGLLAASIARVFFPADDPASGVLAAFAVFGVANVMRPLGGLVLGPLGDRFGRRTVLLASVAGISVATFLVGILPGPSAIGVAAPILLVLLRLLQGFSAGGEVISVVTYVAEHSPAKRRGLLTAFLQSGSTGAFLLASLVVYLVSAVVPESAFDVWGWRIPFLLALPLGVLALWLRFRLDESPVFTQLRAEGEISRTPLRDALTGRPWLIVQSIGVVALTFGSSFVFLTYFPTMLRAAGLTSQEAFLVTTVGLAASVVTQPLMGALSDRVGRKPVALAAAVFFAVGSYPLFGLMASGSLAAAMVGMSLLAVGLGGAVAVVICFFTEFTSSRTRMATFAVGYNIGGALFGGPALFLAQLLTVQTGDPSSPAYFLMGTAVISFVALLSIRDYARTGEPIR
ncbi:MFS transporter [Prauserella cavernicola]|uniref:MFS transporter n=1 Tax=Prauserella cavernicola TaxID=2800127 RepID=A0A934QVJ0_9PSEU|nr:MFS transporter [Prauserella cavernicola]MBK1787326.1 MFS transporter [Prauserella cavernicola]